MSTGLLLAMAVLWLTTVAMILVKTPQATTMLYRIQAAGEASVAAILAVAGHRPLLWAIVGLILVVKIMIIPAVVTRGLAPLGEEYGAKGPMGMTALLLLALILTSGGLLVGRLGFAHSLATGLVFAAMLVAFLQLSGRYEVWSLLWAMLSLETVMDAGALLLGTGLPTILEAGIGVTGLAMALVLVYVAAEVRRTIHSLDVRDLGELIG